MIYLYFAVIAVMRALQTVSTKKTSALVDGSVSAMRFMGYSNAAAAVAGLVLTAFEGFKGFGISTLILGGIAGLSVAAATLAGLFALKSSSVALNSVFTNAAVLIPSIAGIFLFGERIRPIAYLAMGLFVVAVVVMSLPEKRGIKLRLKTILLLSIVF